VTKALRGDSGEARRNDRLRLHAAVADLAERASLLSLAEVPSALKEHAALVLADTVGVIMAGTTQPDMAALLKRSRLLGIRRSSPRQRAPLLLSPGLSSAPATTAAMINGAAATSLELDEGVRPTGHPSAHIVPAVLAAAQALGNTGAEVLAAYLSGYEVAARLFEALELRDDTHPHGHLGAIGAAVAVARLRGVSPSGAALAAGTLPILGSWQACFEGATVRNFYTGLGAATGVVAPELAASGFVGSLSSVFGSRSGIAPRVRRIKALTDPVDPSSLRLADNYLKLHSACALSHSAIDAVLAIDHLDPSQVSTIEVETCARAMRLARPSVGSPLSSRFSLPYAVAVAAVRGRAGPEDFQADPAVAELAGRIKVRADDALTAAWPDQLATRVTVHLTDGRTVRREVANPVGHATRRPDRTALAEKFQELAWAPRPGELYERLLAISSEHDVYGLFLDAAR
jgi:2-methylcitrate dehydratase PrpD